MHLRGWQIHRSDFETGSCLIVSFCWRKLLRLWHLLMNDVAAGETWPELRHVGVLCCCPTLNDLPWRYLQRQSATATPSNQYEIFLLLLRGRSTQALTHAHPPAAAFCVTLLPRLAAVVPPNLLMHADTAAILLYPKVDHRIQRDSSVGREKKFHSICTFVSITDTVGILKKCLWSKQQTFCTVWAVNGCFPLFFSCSFEACSRAFSRLLWNSTSACCPYCLTAALFTLFLSKITRHCPECIDAGSKKLRPGLRRKNSSTRWHGGRGGAVLLLYLSWGGEKKKDTMSC